MTLNVFQEILGPLTLKMKTLRSFETSARRNITNDPNPAACSAVRHVRLHEMRGGDTKLHYIVNTRVS